MKPNHVAAGLVLLALAGLTVLVAVLSRPAPARDLGRPMRFPDPEAALISAPPTTTPEHRASDPSQQLSPAEAGSEMPATASPSPASSAVSTTPARPPNRPVRTITVPADSPAKCHPSPRQHDDG
jgi:hypothetical protein